MKQTSRFRIGLKALSELGFEQVGRYALYRLGLSTGHYQRRLAAALSRLNKLNRSVYFKLQPCLPGLPDPASMITLLGDQIDNLYEQADEIVNGRVRLFGGNPAPLTLSLPEPLKDWVDYEGGTNQVGGQDIKYVWEPGRFGWACTLAMAYHLSKNERYRQAFWNYTDQFLISNPPYRGPHWSSAQEVAIRLVALAFALQVFNQPGAAPETQLEMLAKSVALSRSIAIHAERIRPTLIYARSQNNNHLITEALGLYTASAMLPSHPLAGKWHKLGTRWLHHAFLSQIEPDGTYIQHSSNYHRLMLQAALWAVAVQDHCFKSEPIPHEVNLRLAASTRWILSMLDSESGRVPNLGPNDGAYILPLTAYPYIDYRPVIYAAAASFLQTRFSPGGPWEDMSRWFGIMPAAEQSPENISSWRMRKADNKLPSQPPYILINPVNGSWAVLRAAKFHSRPTHADQLNLDLWWQGLNLALDPGTYLYNAPAPWENSLTGALVHNTVTVDHQDFMHRAGRFLYLNWAQGKVVGSADTPPACHQSLAAQHNGYRQFGITHVRTVADFEDGHWEIIDRLVGPINQIHTFRLHWLLPDWPYELSDNSNSLDHPGYAITLQSSHGPITLQSAVLPPQRATPLPKPLDFKLARAGELLVGSGTIAPITGFYSPTYGVKIPALAFILESTTNLPITFKSQWNLPGEG